MSDKTFYVYILTNQLRTVLYTGITNNLEQRIIEHWTARGINRSFTSKYHVYYLLFYESYKYVNDAIAREKEIKGWSRSKKMQLINAFNPQLTFLNGELFSNWPPEEITTRM